MLKLVCANLT